MSSRIIRSHDLGVHVHMDMWTYWGSPMTPLSSFLCEAFCIPAYVSMQCLSALVSMYVEMAPVFPYYVYFMKAFLANVALFRRCTVFTTNYDFVLTKSWYLPKWTETRTLTISPYLETILQYLLSRGTTCHTKTNPFPTLLGASKCFSSIPYPTEWC